MSGDPHQCRLNAERCKALAKRSKKVEVRRTFLVMADTWRKLAAELKSDGPLLRAISEMELGQPYDAEPMP